MAYVKPLGLPSTIALSLDCHPLSFPSHCHLHFTKSKPMCVVRTKVDNLSMHGLFSHAGSWELQKALAKVENKRIQHTDKKRSVLSYDNTKMQNLCPVLWNWKYSEHQQLLVKE